MPYSGRVVKGKEVNTEFYSEIGAWRGGKWASDGELLPCSR